MVKKKKLKPTEAAKIREAKRKAEYTERGSVTESEEMHKLETELNDTVTQYNFDLSRYIAKSEHYLDYPEQIEKKSSSINQMYQQRMFMMCAMPLARGLSADSVIGSVGMYAGMCMVDKDFHRNIKRNLGNSLAPVAENFAEKINAKYPPGHPLKTMADKAQTWRDNFIKKENGGRMPFTPQSAAVQDLAIHTMAYNAMREPGADIDKIKTQFSDARERLFELAQRDGISKEDICQQVRVIVGKQCMREERAAQFGEHEDTMGGRMNICSGMFTEMNPGSGNCDVHRNDFHKEDVLQYDENGEPCMKEKEIWNGEFTMADGENYEPYVGDFTPRPPDSSETIADNIRSTIDDAAFMASDGKAFYNNMAAIYHSAHGRPKVAMDYGARGSDDVECQATKYAASEMFRVYRNALLDGEKPDEVSEYATAYWSRTVQEVLDMNPDWAKDWAKYCEEDKVRQRQEAEAGRQKTEKSYHCPVDGYDVNVEDNSNGRASEFEAQHPELFNQKGDNGAEYSM